jgi:hypothetical protein
LVTTSPFWNGITSGVLCISAANGQIVAFISSVPILSLSFFRLGEGAASSEHRLDMMQGYGMQPGSNVAIRARQQESNAHDAPILIDTRNALSISEFAP